jgi:hypothetical protein
MCVRTPTYVVTSDRRREGGWEEVGDWGSDVIRLPVCIRFIDQNRCCPYIRHTGKIWPYFPYVVCIRLTGKNDLGRMYDIRANVGRMSVCPYASPSAFSLLVVGCMSCALCAHNPHMSQVQMTKDTFCTFCVILDPSLLFPQYPVRISCCILCISVSCILYLYRARVLHL